MVDRVRVTVSMEPHVLEVYQRMAEASGVSVSRCLGDWLGDTSEAAQLAGSKMARIRRTPLEVAMEHKRYMGVQANQILDRMEAAGIPLPGAKTARGSAAAGSPARGAPSSNTGLKSPRRG